MARYLAVDKLSSLTHMGTCRNLFTEPDRIFIHLLSYSSIISSVLYGKPWRIICRVRYGDVTWASCRLKSPTIRLFIRLFAHANITENFKAPSLGLCDIMENHTYPYRLNWEIWWRSWLVYTVCILCDHSLIYFRVTFLLARHINREQFSLLCTGWN